MITPVFRQSQDGTYLIIIIRVPYVKISTSEVFVEKFNFRFYLKPYYLNLTFKEELVEEEPESAVYDHNTYEITLKCKKTNIDEHFTDLDMITCLQKPKMEKKKVMYKPKIEVLSETNDSKETTELMDDKKNNDELLGNFRCGFNLSFQEFFKNLEEEAFELTDLNPDITAIEQRVELMILYENQSFSPEHYLQDYFEADLIKSQLKDPFKVETKKDPIILIENSYEDFCQKNVEYFQTDNESNALSRLPNKHYLVNDYERKILYSQLVDILQAYCYEMRTQIFDLTSESAASINSLSYTLSCSVSSITDLQESIICSLRRQQIFALYRNWILCEQSLKDLLEILKFGRKLVVKAQLQIKVQFERTEPRHFMNISAITNKFT